MKTAKEFIERFIECWKECSYDGTYVSSHGPRQTQHGMSQGIICNVVICDQDGNYYEVDNVTWTQLMGCGCASDVRIEIKKEP